MARLAVYGAISTILAGGVIASAFAQRSNFYSACIYLYKSNACMMVITARTHLHERRTVSHLLLVNHYSVMRTQRTLGTRDLSRVAILFITVGITGAHRLAVKQPHEDDSDT